MLKLGITVIDELFQKVEPDLYNQFIKPSKIDMKSIMRKGLNQTF